MNRHHILLLLNRQWQESRKTWPIAALAIASVLSFLILLITHWRTSFNGDTPKGVFLLLLFAGGSIFISTLFKDLGNKHKGVWLLILPATAAEKLIVALFYGIAVYLFIYLGIFFTIQEIMRLVLGNDALPRVDLFKNGFYKLLFPFINFQSVMLLGSLFFHKNQLLKTLLLLIAGAFLVYNANAWVLKFVTGEVSITSAVPLDSFQFVYRNENIYVNATPGVQLASTILCWLIIPVALWLAAWCRLKEKEL